MLNVLSTVNDIDITMFNLRWILKCAGLHNTVSSDRNIRALHMPRFDLLSCNNVKLFTLLGEKVGISLLRNNMIVSCNQVKKKSRKNGRLLRNDVTLNLFFFFFFQYGTYAILYCTPSASE